MSEDERSAGDATRRDRDLRGTRGSAFNSCLVFTEFPTASMVGSTSGGQGPQGEARANMGS